jgi:hypothetical protein
MDVFLAAALGGLIAAAIMGMFLKFYLTGYLTEKGKNLATKEDIEQITDKINP